jgi:glutaredoxin-related protein
MKNYTVGAIKWNTFLDLFLSIELIKGIALIREIFQKEQVAPQLQTSAAEII